jgi:hypothetical protein
MKCIFCEKLVFGVSGMSLGNLGVAHRQCFTADEALKRTFQNLDIRALNDQELVELKDLVLTEENARRPPGDVDEIELF